MPRGLVAFAAFCVLFAVGVLGLRAWMGPHVFDFAVDTDRHDVPAVLLVFRGREDGGCADADWQAFLPIAQRDAGELLHRSESVRLVHGRIVDEWCALAAFRFADGRGLARMVTGDAFRSLASQRPTLLMLADGDLRLGSARVWVVHMASLSNNLATQAGAAFDRLRDAQGVAEWTAAVPLTPLSGEAEDRPVWTWLAAAGFDSHDAAVAWTRAAAVADERDVLAAQVPRLATWVVDLAPEG